MREELVGHFKTIWDNTFVRIWNPTVAAVFVGLLSAFYFGLTGTVWAVTGEFTRIGGHVLILLGVDTSGWSYLTLIKFNPQQAPWERTDGWIVFGMLFGALISTLFANNFKIRVPMQKRRLVQGFVGGLLAGFGARLAMGCNLAAFFTGIPQFSLHSWLFMLGTLIGSYFGVKIALHPLMLGKPDLRTGGRGPVRPPAKKRRSVQPLLGAGILLLYTGICCYFFLMNQWKLGIAAIFGGLFGLAIDRGQICFTSAFRDLWVSGRSVMARALAVGILVATLATAVFHFTGLKPISWWASPGALVGGLLFGVGIVIAGGCETGWMYRVVGGQVQFLVVGIGNIVGASLLAWGWDHLNLYNTFQNGWPKINLLQQWGWAGAIGGTVLLLVAWYLFSLLWGAKVRCDLQAKGKAADMEVKIGREVTFP
ncbi:selenium metabolism membrane protein YedE/FdhT [Effusibacillus pohliae]|uniref:selenium metabolism membrane protein YedE/FdhT n=1 Tax=Effusibacillus pohliae TaxID=232270 RepID=UPI00037AA7D1|nr:selenium metabolism membrane protein YedE/FdhT [Effusibacillus pohliae]